MSENPVLVAVLSAGRPVNMVFVLMTLFTIATIYIGRYSVKDRSNAIISGAAALLPISAWFGIQDLTARANDNVPDASIPRLDENAWLIALIIVALAAYTCVHCLTEKTIPKTTMNRAAALSGSIMLVVGSISYAAGCTVLYLTNNASVLKVWALATWQYTTLITAGVGVIFVISAVLAVVAHLRRVRRTKLAHAKLEAELIELRGSGGDQE